jgi:hypothetical protein
LHEPDSFNIEIIAHRLQLRLCAGRYMILLLDSIAGALYRSNLRRKLEEVSLSHLNAISPSKRFAACYHVLLNRTKIFYFSRHRDRYRSIKLLCAFVLKDYTLKE